MRAAHNGLSNPVDAAIFEALGAADRTGAPCGDLPHRGVLPFSSARKMMATFRGNGDHLVACVKGAPAAVLPAVRRAPHELRASAARRVDAAVAS